MASQFHIFEVFGMIILFEASLYFVFLIGRFNSLKNRILSFIILTIILAMMNLFVREQIEPEIPYFYFESVALLAPLQYLYVLSISRPSFQLEVKNLFHLLGFFLLLALRVLLPDSASEPLVFQRAISIPLFLYCFSYLALSIRTLGFFEATVLANRSDARLKDLRWLRIEILIIGVYFSALAAESLGIFIPHGSWYEVVVFVSFLSILLLINILIFKGLNSPEFPDGATEKEREILESVTKNYRGSTLSQEVSLSYFAKARSIIEDEMLFKDFNLTLSKLAEKLDQQPATLSRVINENSGQNFNDFVNGFRVNEAKKLLSTNRDILIKEVMYESGFQSTSTFNSSFKKLTGKSPSEFKSQVSE